MLGRRNVGGHDQICAACTFSLGLLKNMSDYHKGRITYSMQLFCGIIPKPHDKLCEDLAFTYAKYIMDWIGARNARVVCRDFLLCGWIRQKGINKLPSFEHQIVPLLNFWRIFLITEITLAYSLFRSRHRCAAQKRWLHTKYPTCLPFFQLARQQKQRINHNLQKETVVLLFSFPNCNLFSKLIYQ